MINPPILNAILYTFIAAAAFVIPAIFFPADSMVELASGFLMLVCGFAIYRWHRTAAKVYAQGASKPHEHGILAIYILAWGLVFGRVFQVSYIRLERPEWMIQIPLSASFTYILAIGMGLFVIATRVDGEKPSRLVGIVTASLTGLMVFSSALWPILVAKGGVILGFVERLVSILLGKA